MNFMALQAPNLSTSCRYTQHWGAPPGAQRVEAFACVVQVLAFLMDEGFTPSPLEPPVSVSDVVPGFAATLTAASRAVCVAHYAAAPYDLGRLLMDFLYLFGKSFDAKRQGVSVRQGGVVSRAAAGGDKHKGGIAIEDPQARLWPSLCHARFRCNLSTPLCSCPSCLCRRQGTASGRRRVGSTKCKRSG